MPSSLLNLDEMALLLGWLNGVPVDALAYYCGDKNPLAVWAGLRSRLLLKGRRLDKGWGGACLAKPPAANALPKALQRLEKLQPLNVVTVADWLRRNQSCEGGRW